MKQKLTKTLITGLCLLNINYAQALPKYIFYLFSDTSSIYTEQAAYEHRDILDALKSDNFYTYDKNRPPNTQPEEYAISVVSQIDSLLSHGVPQWNITIIGMGNESLTAMEIATVMHKSAMKYVLIGRCEELRTACKDDNPVIYKEADLCGNFYFIETSGTEGCKCCTNILSLPCVKETDGLTLTGDNEEQAYIPYTLWIDPLTSWILSFSE